MGVPRHGGSRNLPTSCITGKKVGASLTSRIPHLRVRQTSRILHLRHLTDIARKTARIQLKTRVSALRLAIHDRLRLLLQSVDFLQARGVRRGIHAQLLRSARFSGQSIWGVLQDTLPYVVGRLPQSAILKNVEERQTSVNRHAVSAAALGSDLPIWATDPAGLPPAKFDQVTNLAHLVHMREVLDTGDPSEIAHPLISQPLIELCLRFPAYLLAANGQSRGLVRMAFAGIIPDAIRRRMTKGGASRYSVDNITANRQKILDQLANGELVKCGLIRRSDVEAFLDHDQYRLQAYGRMVRVYYVIEAWLNTWTRRLADARRAA